MRVGIEASIDDSLLGGFAGLELVRIPAEPDRDIAVDFWVAALEPPNQRKQWPRLKGVKAVQGLWAGVDSLRPIIPKNVTLCSARGVHDGPTAEWTVAAVLAMQKYLYFYSDLQAKADWAGKSGAEDIYLLSEGAKREPNCPVLVAEVADKTVLIVGYGSIGAAVEARLKPFGCKFLRLARSAREGVSAVSALDDLLPLADIVILITPLTKGTRHLINAQRIARMKRGALLVNVGRGGVVETDALVAALNGGRLRAALDVTDPEPLPPEHPLWRAPNLMITPHLTTDTPRFMGRAFAFAAAQAQRFVQGQKLLNIVSGEY
ncbi:MAG TPA: NAD(P)-dependent oxidoreductase [Rhizomicrobium sp.]|nr:NAD(P)-dependent oxidoreductase [Rhizomicrobium sp.]